MYVREVMTPDVLTISSSAHVRSRRSITAALATSAGEQIVEGMEAEAAGGGATLTLWREFVTRFLRLSPG